MNVKKTSASEERDLNSDISDVNEPEVDGSEEDMETGPSAGAEESEQDPIEILNENLRKKDEEIAELKGEFLRYKADTENFKKRLRKEKEDFSQYANERLLKELILINDNLERALSAPDPTVEILKEGVEMILKQFHSFLDKEKVELIESVGQKFDPTLHEVLRQMESDEHEDNTITEEYSKGYRLNGRILRPSKVVVAKAQENNSPSKKEELESSEQDVKVSPESSD